jgi:hypothetical protein
VQEVSLKTLSTTCPGCHKAIMVEDVIVKSYVPVNDLQTCGHITVTKKGRVVAKRVMAGAGLTCEGVVEASLEVAGPIELGSKASWKGRELRTPALRIEDGAELEGRVHVPWDPNAIANEARPSGSG